MADQWDKFQDAPVVASTTAAGDDPYSQFADAPSLDTPAKPDVDPSYKGNGPQPLLDKDATHMLGVTGRVIAEGLEGPEDLAEGAVNDIHAIPARYRAYKAAREGGSSMLDSVNQAGLTQVPPVINPSSQDVDKVLDKFGVARPGTPGERMVSAAGNAALQTLEMDPEGGAAALVSGAASGAGSQGVAEAGGGAGLQTAAAIAGGMAPGALESGINKVATARTPAAAKARNVALQALVDDENDPTAAHAEYQQMAATGNPVVIGDALHSQDNGVQNGANSQLVMKTAAQLTGKGRALAAQTAARSNPQVAASRIGQTIANILNPNKYWDVRSQAIQNMKDTGSVYDDVLDKETSTASSEPAIQNYLGTVSAAKTQAAADLDTANQTLAQAKDAQARVGDKNKTVVNAVQTAQTAVDRATDRVQQLSDHYDNVSNQLQKAQQDRTSNAPGQVWTPMLAELRDDPDVQKALVLGAKQQKDLALGKRPFSNVDNTITGYDDNGNPIIGAVPNLRAWHGAQMILREAAQKAGTSAATEGLSTSAAGLANKRRLILNELDTVRPDYGAVRDTFADNASIKDAADKGLQFDSASTRPEEIGAFFKNPDTTSAEKQAYLSGVVQRTQDLLSKGGKNKAQTIDNLINTGKFEHMFDDPAKYQDFIQQMGINKRMATTDSLVSAGADSESKRDMKETIATAPTDGVLGAMKGSIGSAVYNLKTGAARFAGNLAINALRQNSVRNAQQLTRETATELQKIYHSKDPQVLLDLAAEAKRRGLKFDGTPAQTAVAPGPFAGVNNRAVFNAAIGPNAVQNPAANPPPPSNGVPGQAPQPQSANSPTIMNKLGIISPAMASEPPMPAAYQGMKPDEQDAALDLQNRIGKAESGGNPTAANSASTAFGKYQFTVPQWRSLVYKYGKQAGVTMNDRFDSTAQEKMMPYAMKDNATTLQNNLKRPPADTDIYAAHVLGAGDATNLIKTIEVNPNTPAKEVVAPKAVQANKTIFYKDGQPRSAAEVYQLLQKKIAG